MRVEWVKWQDSRAVEPSWFEIADIHSTKLDALESVGFVAGEDDDRLILVTSYDPHMEKVSSGTIIPKVAILKRKVLRGR